jgi:hypothetical protein
MPLNPDPYYRDPKIEELKSPEPGSTKAIDRFNAPIPGHSLTQPPQNWAWEKPPVYTNPEEAMMYVVERVEKPDVEENFLRLLLAGTPIEAITNTIVFAGFSEGYWTPDMAEILKPPIAMHFMGLAIENEIPATIFNIDPEATKEKNMVSEEAVLELMEKNRPDMYNKLMYAADVLLEDLDESPEGEEVTEGGMMGDMEEMSEPTPVDEGFMSMEEEQEELV